MAQKRPVKPATCVKRTAVTPTPKEVAFIAEYLKHGNATQAFMDACQPEGRKNRARAGREGSRLLHVPRVRKAVDEAQAKQLANADLTAERTLRELARLCYFDPRKIFDSEGKPLPLHDLDDDTAAAIQGVELCKVGNDQMGRGEVLKYRIADKNSALTNALKVLKLTVERVEDVTPPEKRDPLETARRLAFILAEAKHNMEGA